MNGFQDTIALIAAVLGVLLTFLTILEKLGKVPSSIRVFFSKPRVAWGVLVVVLVAFSAYLFLSSRGVFPFNTTFPIERGSVTALPYGGGGGWSYLAVTSVVVGGQLSTRYELDYDLPGEGGAYAGFGLRFSEPQDLAEYNYIELTISFGDEGGRCRLCIDDRFGGYDCVPLGDGRVVSARREAQTIRIPLGTYFTSISRRFVSEIKFDANDSFVQGDHSFTVSEIRFCR